MGSDIGFDTCVLVISLLVVLSTYGLICYADRSWLNWATSNYLISVSAVFVFPLLSLLSVGAVGSRAAYVFCYSSYALTNVCLAIAYVLTRRIPIADSTIRFSPPPIRVLPWVLLAFAILCYVPILVKFFPLILHPREIYEQTRSGYGPLDFGSRAFLNLAFATYLFKQKKSSTGALVFFTLCLAIVFLHGSKGVGITLFSIAMLFWVYGKRRKVGVVRAASVVLGFAVFAMTAFALFANLTDVSELLTYVEGYSDYTKNAMIVIDDPSRPLSWGRLTLEGEFYARIPRFLYPQKPGNFGMFKLAQDYYPEWYRGNTGDPDFNIGMQYADFGPLAIVYLCLTSTLVGIMTGFAVRSLTVRPTVPKFIIMLFFANTPVVTFGAGYALPETLIIASGMWLLTRTSPLPPQPMRENLLLTSPAP